VEREEGLDHRAFARLLGIEEGDDGVFAARTERCRGDARWARLRDDGLRVVRAEGRARDRAAVALTVDELAGDLAGRPTHRDERRRRRRRLRVERDGEDARLAAVVRDEAKLVL